MKILALIIMFLLVNINFLVSDDDTPEIGIDYYNNLGTYLPMDLEFTNGAGETKKLSEIIDRPTVLSLVYFNCPGICSPLLDNLGGVIDLTRAKIGDEYKVISISFDHSETPELAARWKRNYHNALEKPINEEDWEFYVGDSLSIRKLTDAVGFYFKPDGKGDFIHSGTLIMISPEGQIIRYLLGIEYSPFDFQMAVFEAFEGKPTPAIGRVLQYCFSYDPDGKTYVFNVTRVAGTLIFGSVGLLLLVLLVIGRKKKSKNVIGE